MSITLTYVIDLSLKYHFIFTQTQNMYTTNLPAKMRYDLSDAGDSVISTLVEDLLSKLFDRFPRYLGDRIGGEMYPLLSFSSMILSSAVEIFLIEGMMVSKS